MISDFNPYRELVDNITPSEFEEFCMNTLKAYGEREGLKDFSIIHDTTIHTSDGDYQIDVYAEFTAMGCRNKVLVECKHYQRPIERKVVTDLYAKIQSIGANKGIVISTSGFQSGAVQYAGAHGIALWQVIESWILHIQSSVQPNKEQLLLCQKVDRILKHTMLEWNCECDFPLTMIYPTKEMYQEAVSKARGQIDA